MGARRVVALTIAYDGTDFRGFAAQPEQRTVAGELTAALEQSLRGDLADVVCAGRTDAGVHAWGQVVSLTTGADVDPVRLATSLTRRLGPEIVGENHNDVRVLRRGGGDRGLHQNRGSRQRDK